MESVASLTLAALLAIIGAIHFYWAAGGSRGLGLAIPTVPGPSRRPVFTPGRGGTAAAGILFVMAAAISAGLLLPSRQSTLLRAMAAVFALRAVGEFRYVGFFKRVRSTPFATWDTRLFSPLCVALGLLALVASGRPLGLE